MKYVLVVLLLLVAASAGAEVIGVTATDNDNADLYASNYKRWNWGTPSETASLDSAFIVVKNMVAGSLRVAVFLASDSSFVDSTEKRGFAGTEGSGTYGLEFVNGNEVTGGVELMYAINGNADIRYYRRDSTGEGYGYWSGRSFSDAWGATLGAEGTASTTTDKQLNFWLTTTTGEPVEHKTTIRGTVLRECVIRGN
jgi:hypothetical protein